MEFDADTISQMLWNIYKEKYDYRHNIDSELFLATRDMFFTAAATGIADAIENGTRQPSDEFLHQLSHSIEVFSAFRVHRMQNDIAQQMIGNDGEVKPFAKFARDVQPYVSHRNKAWLRTEYDTAIIRAHQAADWQQFEDEKDIMPNLEWVQSTSPNPGADHQIFWGTVRPVDDDFWNQHRPGDRWNCKCELRQTDADTTVPPMSDRATDPQPGLENNPGKDGNLFSQEHPYYPEGCISCPFAGGRLAALYHNLAHKQDCHHCQQADKAISNAKKAQNAEHNAARKEEIMTIVRAHEMADKRPNKLVEVRNMQTGLMLDSRKSFKSLYFHEFNVGEVQAMISFYTKPSKVKFIRVSPLGEGKDMSSPKDIANIAKKIARGVTHYNVYEFKTSNGVYILKTEVRARGFEIPYFICKKE